MMKVQVLQHVPFEGLGRIETWLTERGASVQHTRFYQSAVLPDLRSVDFVIAMGGPMSVNDEHAYPWLKQEKAFLRDAVSRGLSVLGVCLGAQLIASALGARVFADDHKEIGWFPIQTEPFLRSVPDAAYRAVNTLMNNVLSHITGPAR